MEDNPANNRELIQLPHWARISLMGGRVAAAAGVVMGVVDIAFIDGPNFVAGYDVALGAAVFAFTHHAITHSETVRSNPNA